MKLGIDWDGTLASYPHAFIKLMKAASEVHIITLNPTVVLEYVKHMLAVEDMEITLHCYPHELYGWDECHAPEWKAQMCTELRIDVFFDDRQDICEHVEENTETHVMHLTHRDNLV